VMTSLIYFDIHFYLYHDYNLFYPYHDYFFNPWYYDDLYY